MEYFIFVLFTLHFHLIASQYRHPTDNNNNNNNYQNGDYPTDAGDIHYYIWNDLNKRDNFYPNILRNVQNEFQYSAQPIDDNHETAYSMNPYPRPPSTPTTELLTNEMYRTSDSMVIPLLNYAVQQSLLMDKLGQNDRYFRNRKKLNYPDTWKFPMAFKPPETNGARMLPIKAKLLRPNLREMYNDKNVDTFKYYSNLPKPKSLSDPIDHRNYSVVKEPISKKEYSTFEMLEAIPQKVILPPIFNRIPEFKPVPPRLTVIPVVSEYLAKNPNQILSYYRPPMPLDVLAKDSEPNFVTGHRKALPNPPVRMIPFSLGDAITWRSTVHSITPITTTENPRIQLDHGLFVPDKYQSDIISSLGTLDPPHYKEIPIQKIQSHEATMYRSKVNDSSTSETVVNIEQSKKRRNRLSNYKQKLRSYEKSIRKNNANDMNTMSENDIYDIRPVHELVTDKEGLKNEQEQEQQQQMQNKIPSKIQLSEAYSRQTSNVVMPVYPEEHSSNDNYQLKMNVNDDNMIQETTIQSNHFLISIPDDDDLITDESTRASQLGRSDRYSMNFNDRNGGIRNTTAARISLNQTMQAMNKGEHQNYQIRGNQNQVATLTPAEKYKKWFEDFKEKNRQKGKPIYSEHFRKVEIQPNIQWTEPKNQGHR